MRHDLVVGFVVEFEVSRDVSGFVFLCSLFGSFGSYFSVPFCDLFVLNRDEKPKLVRVLMDFVLDDRFSINSLGSSDI